MKDNMIKKAIVVRIVVIIIGIFVGFNGVYLSSVHKGEQLRAQLEDEIKRVVMLQEVDILLKRIGASEQLLPAYISGPVILEKISQAAQKNNIKVLATTPLPQQSYGSYKKVALNVKVVGTFAQIGKFIHMLESSELLCKVEQCGLKGDALAGLQQPVRVYERKKEEALATTAKAEGDMIISVYGK